MPENKLIFTFADLSVKDRAAKQAMKYFARAGANVVAQDVSPQIKRTSGISYREMTLIFNDSQKATLRIKQSGDIFQFLLNGKLTPIKNQDDHIAAVGEIAQMIDAGRTKFQAKLARVLIKLPPAIKTAEPKMLAVLTEKRDALKSAIADVRTEIDDLKNSNNLNSSNNLTNTDNDSTAMKISEMSYQQLSVAAKNYDNLQNEGTQEGYNPYREQMERMENPLTTVEQKLTPTLRAGNPVFPQPKAVMPLSFVAPSNAPKHLMGKTLENGIPAIKDGHEGVAFKVFYNKVFNDVFVTTGNKPEFKAQVEAYNSALVAAIDENKAAISAIKNDPEKLALYESAYLRSEESFSRGEGKETMNILMAGGSVEEARAKLDRDGIDDSGYFYN